MAEQHPEEVLDYLLYMNRRQYFEAHEVLEGYWHGERIDFYKGLIQVAVALFHLNTGNIAGCRALFTRAHELLTPYQPEFRALNVQRVLNYIEDSLACIPNVVGMEAVEARALGVEALQLWLEDGTELPAEPVVPLDEEDGE
ncbi:DUF309 domain-containing protein [Tumebacillus permanentifrigoris]|uniref:Putative metal-dependent hydrolase n=1 Tax=Tumebacillus permanentifrigoris TaxID=378543 RepID=A0A316DDY7_9BACL|nr:DUF309 domain-containing protein [Tumebacillus permanentifrigoris]PWK15916.1 putative metal-dependent hydrolase [Tumebacillus permanentifrigoris]